MLKITKKGTSNFVHFNGFVEMNFSTWQINFNDTLQNVILVQENGATFPKVAETIANVIVVDETDTSIEETFATTQLLRARLIEIGYNALVSSEGGGGGSVTSVNTQTGDVVLDATDVGAIPNSTTSATPVLADKMIIKDVSDSNNSKEITLTDLKLVVDNGAIKDEQIEISANTNVLDAWNGKTILVTASCTITVPATLINQLMFVGRTLAGVTITWVITSPFAWETTPTTTTEKKTFSFMRRGSTNTILFDS